MIQKRFTFAALFFTIVALICPPMGTAYVTVGYSPQKTDFSVSFRDETSSQKITPVFVLPGEEISMKITSDDQNDSFAATELTGLSSSKKPTVLNGVRLPGHQTVWHWTAPQKTGTYLTTLQDVKTGASMDLRVFVMVPFSQKRDTINGFKIGQYPHIPASKENLYTLPRGFVEVTNENKDLMLTPHFKLSQFLCKQQSGAFPQYVVLRERLLFKLEYVLEHVNQKGIAAKTFSVMSGYRTPFYNRALGNVKYSRHMWGDAADIYVNDDPHAIGMGDLNGDGKCDIKDAELLYGIVNQLNDEPSFKMFIGGLGRYKPTAAHGPFVHVDARGARANWSSN